MIWWRDLISLNFLAYGYRITYNEEALKERGLHYLSKRRDMACQKLLRSLRNDEPSYNHPLTTIVRPVIPQRFHNVSLRDDNPELSPIISERHKNFFTIKFEQHS